MLAKTQNHEAKNENKLDETSLALNISSPSYYALALAPIDEYDFDYT